MNRCRPSTSWPLQRYRQALFQIRQVYQLCRTAQIKLAILEKAVADTTIRAPFDGWVAEKLVAVGEQISSGMQATKVVTLVRIDPLRLLADGAAAGHRADPAGPDRAIPRR